MCASQYLQLNIRCFCVGSNRAKLARATLLPTKKPTTSIFCTYRKWSDQHCDARKVLVQCSQLYVYLWHGICRSSGLKNFNLPTCEIVVGTWLTFQKGTSVSGNVYCTYTTLLTLRSVMFCEQTSQYLGRCSINALDSKLSGSVRDCASGQLLKWFVYIC